MNTVIHTILAVAVLGLTVPVQSADDTTLVEAREVRITASKWLDATVDGFLASSSIPVEVMQRIAPPTVSDVMHVVPGVHVRQYGGLGGLRTVSIRGTGSAQTLVLLDGIRLSSVQNGTVDLGLIPGSIIGSVDVIRGGAAAIYGTNAMSGVIDLRLRRPSSNEAWCTVGGGSFDEVDVRGGGATTIDGVSLSVAVDALRTQGTYPYALRHAGSEYVINRANADVSNISAIAHAGTDRWSLFTVMRAADRGVPGPLIEGVTIPSRARLLDNDGVIGISASLLNEGAWTVSMTGSLRVWDQRFTDPDATVMGPRGIDEGYVQRDATWGLLIQHTSERHIMRGRIESGFADLRGRMLQPDVGSEVVRRSAAAAAEWQWQPWTAPAFTVRSALRLDAISDAGSAVTPLVALRWDVNEDASLRASYSYDFRAPSFNELYYLNYGTSTLRPERSQTLNIGTDLSLMSWLRADVDVFAMATTDQILAVPTSAVTIAAQNIGRTSAVGLECGLRAALLDDKLLAHWSYTLQDVRDRSGRAGIDGTLLPYVPQEMISIGASYAAGDVTAGLQWSYVSHRYAQSGELLSALLARYHLLGATVVLRSRLRSGLTSLGIDVRLQIENLLNMRYDVIQGFPMPGRTIRVLTSIRWERP
jgi:outer membrane cobalamin receptor